MMRDQHGISVSGSPDSLWEVRSDWIDRLEYTASQILGYALLAAAAGVGVALML